jgi:hypothetical protein
MSTETIDALEAWHATTRALRDATPGTADWHRLRMIAQEQRAVYEALLEDAKSTMAAQVRKESLKNSVR